MTPTTPGGPASRVVCSHPAEGDLEPVNDQLPGPAPRRLEVTLFGPVAASVLNVLDDRYDHVHRVWAPRSGQPS